MRNAEIAGIAGSYMEQKEAAVKARKEGKEQNELRLPARIAWIRRVNMDKIFQANRMIEEAIREIEQKYADDAHSIEIKTDSGEVIRKVRDEMIGEFIREKSEIMEQNTDVDLKKISIDDLEGLDLSESEMDTLAFMIEE